MAVAVERDLVGSDDDAAAVRTLERGVAADDERAPRLLTVVAAGQPVGARAPGAGVVAAAAVEHVVTGSALQAVVARAPVKLVVTLAAVDDVTAGPASDGVGAGTGADRVVAAAARDDVVGYGADDDIGALGARGLEARDGHDRGDLAETGGCGEALLGLGQLLGGRPVTGPRGFILGEHPSRGE